MLSAYADNAVIVTNTAHTQVHEHPFKNQVKGASTHLMRTEGSKTRKYDSPNRRVNIFESSIPVE